MSSNRPTRHDTGPVNPLVTWASGGSLLVRIGIAVVLSLCWGTGALAITTSGTLSGDETWLGMIVLTGDVTVPEGVTLTIEAGTVVRAQIFDDLAGGLDTSRIELIVEGTLNLQGTADLPVTFSSTQPVPDAGDWYGIRLTDTADSTVVIHDLIVEAAVRGIWSYPGSHQDVVDCTVRDTIDHGIYMQFGGSPRDVADPGILLSGNTVERTGPHTYVIHPGGIQLVRAGSLPSWDDAVHQIVDNFTDDTGARGVYVSPGDAERVEITNNDISNTEDGVYLSLGEVERVEITDNDISSAEYGIQSIGSSNQSSSSANRFEITENQIADASQTGVYQIRGHSVLIADNTLTGGLNGIQASSVFNEGRIVNNTVTGFTGVGIGVAAPDSSPEMTVHRNVITAADSASATGIRTERVWSMTVLYNSLTNVYRGFWVQGFNEHGPRIHWNNIDAFGTVAEMVNSPSAADMRRNYWSATNAEMQAAGYPANIDAIVDIEDNDGLGRIDYRGVENLPIDTAVSLESRFVWPFPSDTLSAAGITIKGTAYAEAGVQRVEVTTDGGAFWQPTDGADAWSFEFTPDADGLQTFLCRVVDDNDAVETTPDAITVDFDFLLPTTEGLVSADEHWSGDMILTGDVIVPAGIALTIDPGTTIRMQPYADNRHGGIDESRIELIVEGTLVVQGTGPGSISLTTASPAPHHSQWYGIRYAGTARALPDLRGLLLEWGMTGLSHEGDVGIPSLEDVTIRNMKEDGVTATSSPEGTDTWTFRNLYISDTGESGAQLRGEPDVDVLVEGTTVENAGYYALKVVEGGVATVRDSTFENTGDIDTLYIYGFDTILVKGVEATGIRVRLHAHETGTIDDSEISGRLGVLVTWGVTTIRNSRITGQSRGVELASSYTSGLLENNHISSTTLFAVRVYSGASAVLRFNDLDPIDGYTLDNQTANPTDASDNYWGPTTTAEMDAAGCDSNISTIRDARDNGSLGLVTYCDYAAGPFGDQATILFRENGPDLEVRWNPKGGLNYDLIRGNVAALAAGAGTVDLGTVSCLESANSTGIIVDTSGAPTSGAAWFYLLRDGSTPGNYGRDSAGRERIPAAGDCP